MIFPSWLEMLAALHSAQTCEELWSVLLTPHGIKSTSAWEEPLGLFGRFHRHDDEGAYMTALLLCTDPRWRKAAHHLISRLADSGMLDDGTHGRETGTDIVVVERTVWPPLRRWAATRQIRRDPTRWRDLLELARSYPSRDADALASGVMNSADAVDPDERGEVLELGLTWGSGTVRLAALPGFADLHGFEQAKERASADPSEKVRAWTTKHAPLPIDPSSGTSADVPPLPSKRRGHPDQPSLFG